MLDTPAPAAPDIVVHPGRRLKGRVAGLYIADGKDFETRPVETLPLGFEGIAGDVHGGTTRKSSSREPWYPRGTEIRNERQLTIVSNEELAVVAAAMDLPEIRPEWIGANLLFEGVPRLTFLPAGTLLFFKGGVTIKVDAQNAPCRIAGKRLAKRAGMEDVEGGALAFPKAAARLRGVTAWVEKPGTIALGEDFTVRIPEQWIYAP